jgi:hypothetical protein
MVSAADTSDPLRHKGIVLNPFDSPYGIAVSSILLRQFSAA